MRPVAVLAVGEAVRGAAVAEREATVAALVREHHAFVWRSARRLGVREADLDDVVQEVFVTVARNVADIRPGSERGFLFRTTVFASAHARRTVQRRREVADERAMHEEIDAQRSPEENIAHAQARQRLQGILDVMPEDARVVFVLFELERMTMAEIAETLGVPPGTVASRLRRARELFTSEAARTRSHEELP